METRQRLNMDLKQAMRSGDAQTRDTIRMLQAAFKQAEIDDGSVLDEEGVQSVLLKQAKQRRESIDAYESGGRAELAEVERQELEVIERYLPQMMSRAEIEQLAAQTIDALGASSPRDMGRVMGRLMPQLQGKADGSVVSAVVRQLLAAQG